MVFPTCVGVFLMLVGTTITADSLPHMRGGVSVEQASRGIVGGSSPHAWGCFPVWGDLIFQPGVFPTCVGVFPGSRQVRTRLVRLPHMRGGVS